jgi:hypothetical protein
VDEVGEEGVEEEGEEAVGGDEDDSWTVQVVAPH